MTQFCHAWLEENTGCAKALLTQSCTDALEMAALVAEIGAGDEVIMPSYTFATSASAFALRGAVPIFVDVRPDTLNLDERLVEGAITPKTRAILAVHYAGVACEMAILREIADRHGLFLIEDAAQAIMSKYQDQPLGGMGHMGTYSFHETKNIVSGEGGALLVNDPNLVERAEIVWEKGTNRRQFLRGHVDKYTWVTLGSSFLPSEITSAVLRAQLEQAGDITCRRMAQWDRYYTAFADIESEGLATRPSIPQHCTHNAHIFRLILKSPGARNRVLKYLNDRGIGATFHYIPLHSSPAGIRYGRIYGDMVNTDDLSARLLRLPMSHMTDADLAFVIAGVNDAVRSQ